MRLAELNLPEEIEEKVRFWLGEEFDRETRSELERLIQQGKREELIERFYPQLDFGTGGMRGLLGAGTNRMNKYVIGMATQGLANYLLKQADSREGQKVVIAYDSRHFSREFAEETASVLAGNGIKVFLFDDLRPMPELSFAVRYLNARAGVGITASHNPKEYNGYKVYWSDGAQVVPPQDENIIAEVRKIRSPKEVKRLDFKQAESNGLIEIIGKEMDEEYLKAIYQYAITPGDDLLKGGELRIVYTPLHGSGIKLVPRALKEWGFTNLMICAEQAQPDGDFPSVESPNPEERKALLPAINVARRHQGELLLANDPDCDRLGVVIRQPDGEYEFLSGNQLSCLLGYFILSQLKEQERLPERPAVVTTVVTTQMLEAIAHSFGAHTEYTLTGFKWICEKPRLWENLPHQSPHRYNFVYGTEESYGYVVGTAVRDKDGVISACVTAELALWAKIKKGKTLLEIMDELYQQYGVFVDETHSIYLTGAEGEEKINYLMERLRRKPPAKIGKLSVIYITDVKQRQRIERRTGKKIVEVTLPQSNVIIWELSGGNKVVARPSGTEPKIKFYFLFQDRENLPIKTAEELEERKVRVRAKLAFAREAFLSLIESLIKSSP